MSVIEHITTPPPRGTGTPGAAPSSTGVTGGSVRRTVVRAGAALVGLLIAAGVIMAAQQPGTGLSPQGAVTLMVFILAVWFWIFTAIDDTYIALGAATVLVLTGTMDTASLFSTLGEETIWLLLAAFVAGVMRATPDDGFSGGFAYGAAGGAALGVVALVVLALRERRRATAA